MIINKKAESGVEEVGSEVINIIISIIVLIGIAFLIYIMYNFYTEKENMSRAKSELNEISLALKSTYERGGVSDYTVIYAPKWYLFSSEFPELCDPGPFCLCLCEDADCEDKRARSCIPTDKFVVLRKSDNNFLEHRVISLPEPPSTLKLGSIKQQTAYPFLGAPTSVTTGFLIIDTVTPVFYKFEEGKWLWSPDLQSWFPISTTEVTEGKWKDAGTVNSYNVDFIHSIDQTVQHSSNPEADVRERFHRLRATESKDFYLIEI